MKHKEPFDLSGKLETKRLNAPHLNSNNLRTALAFLTCIAAWWVVPELRSVASLVTSGEGFRSQDEIARSDARPILEIEVADTSFGAYLLREFDLDSDGRLSKEEREAVETIDTPGKSVPQTGQADRQRIADLRGIGYFPNLRTIDCSGENLRTLPDLDSLRRLEELRCSGNEIRRLPKLPSSLRKLLLYDNDLREIPDLTYLASLEELNVHTNRLTDLPNLPTSLRSINIRANFLRDLDGLPISVERLWVSGRFLIRLSDLSRLTRLEELFLLHSSVERISRLPTSLRYLNCMGSRIQHFPDLSFLPALDTFWCGGNYFDEKDCRAILAVPSSVTKLRYNPLADGSTLECLPDNRAVTVNKFEASSGANEAL